MAHSVSSIGFRLCHDRRWSAVPPSLLLPLNLFDRKLFPLPQSVLASSGFIEGSSTGRLSLYLPLYTHFFALIGRLLRRSSLAWLLPFFFLFVRDRLIDWFETLLRPLVGQIPQLNLRLLFSNRPSPLLPLLVRHLAASFRQRQPAFRLSTSFINSSYRFLCREGAVGMLLKVAGRYTRTQRASSFFLKRGKTPFASVSSSVCYNFSTVILKYGCCSLHLWVFYEQR